MANRIKTKQIDGDIAGGIYNCGFPDITQSSTIGGASSALASFWKTQTISQVLDAILFPYQNPGMTLTVSGDSIYEVGQEVETNSISLSWSTTNPNNAQDNVVFVRDDSAGQVLVTARPKTGSIVETYTPKIKLTSPGSYSWTASGLNTKGVVYDKTTSKTWAWRKYWGTAKATSLSNSLFTNFGAAITDNSKYASSSPAGPYTLPGGGYRYFAWPSTTAQPRSFKASNGFDMTLATAAEGYTLTNSSGLPYRQFTITNAYGASTTYNIFRSYYDLGSGDVVTVT